MSFKLLRENVLDSDGHKFSPELLKKFDGKKVPTCINFDKEKCVGETELLYKEGVGLEGKLLIKDNETFDKYSKIVMYPSIGGIIKDVTEFESSSLKDKTKPNYDVEFDQVGLTLSPNIDAEIKPIKLSKENKS